MQPTTAQNDKCRHGLTVRCTVVYGHRNGVQCLLFDLSYARHPSLCSITCAMYFAPFYDDCGALLAAMGSD